MFVATWKVGPTAELGKDVTWTEAVRLALELSAKSDNRDELIKVEWVGKGE
jgi:hypothetical protein